MSCLVYMWNNTFICLNPLPNYKILIFSKMASIYRKFFVWLKIIEFVYEMVENIMGKGENAGDQHFLLFHIIFARNSVLSYRDNRGSSSDEVKQSV